MQFPSSTQVRAEQRGQQPYVADSKAALSEQMLECSPPQLQLKGSDMTQVINLAKGISQFGMSLTPLPCFVSGSLERHGFSTTRFQWKGSREVFAVHWLHVKNYIEKNFPDKYGRLKDNLMEEVQSFFVTMDPEELKTFLISQLPRDSKIVPFCKSLMKEGNVVFIPKGYLVAERVVGDCHVVGLRASSLDHINNEGFVDLVKTYQDEKAEEEWQPFKKKWEKYIRSFKKEGETDKPVASLEEDPHETGVPALGGELASNLPVPDSELPPAPDVAEPSNQVNNEESKILDPGTPANSIAEASVDDAAKPDEKNQGDVNAQHTILAVEPPDSVTQPAGSAGSSGQDVETTKANDIAPEAKQKSDPLLRAKSATVSSATSPPTRHPPKTMPKIATKSCMPVRPVASKVAPPGIVSSQGLTAAQKGQAKGKSYQPPPQWQNPKQNTWHKRGW